MRISDLGRQSGIPIATIKFYLREGLLPPGIRTARNQAEYDNEHLTRLRLIRILTAVGKLSLSSVREVLAAIDDTGLPTRERSRVVNRTLFREQPALPDLVDATSARICVDEFVTKRGWRLEPGSPGPDTLAHVLAALLSLGWDCDAAIFAPYADAAERLAEHEHELLPCGPSTAVLAGPVLFEVALAALRRMAHENLLAMCPSRH